MRVHSTYENKRKPFLRSPSGSLPHAWRAIWCRVCASAVFSANRLAPVLADLRTLAKSLGTRQFVDFALARLVAVEHQLHARAFESAQVRDQPLAVAQRGNVHLSDQIHRARE